MELWIRRTAPLKKSAAPTPFDARVSQRGDSEGSEGAGWGLGGLGSGLDAGEDEVHVGVAVGLPRVLLDRPCHLHHVRPMRGPGGRRRVVHPPPPPRRRAPAGALATRPTEIRSPETGSARYTREGLGVVRGAPRSNLSSASPPLRPIRWVVGRPEGRSAPAVDGLLVLDVLLRGVVQDGPDPHPGGGAAPKPGGSGGHQGGSWDHGRCRMPAPPQASSLRSTGWGQPPDRDNPKTEPNPSVLPSGGRTVETVPAKSQTGWGGQHRGGHSGKPPESPPSLARRCGKSSEKN